MKRIVVVEDSPWKVMQSIQTLQKEGVEFCKTIFYPNNLIDKKSKEELMEEYKRVTGMEVVQVDTQIEFLDQMNESYDDPDIIFLMDFDLKGDMNANDFFSRINVKYALAKKTEKEDEKGKIWFYTSGPSDIKGLLMETFPGRLISTPLFYEGQLYWDNDQVKRAAELNQDYEKGTKA